MMEAENAAWDRRWQVFESAQDQYNHLLLRNATEICLEVLLDIDLAIEPGFELLRARRNLIRRTLAEMRRTKWECDDLSGIGD